jgi:NAD/NADP transhydrogenase beta subunit
MGQGERFSTRFKNACKNATAQYVIPRLMDTSRVIVIPGFGIATDRFLQRQSFSAVKVRNNDTVLIQRCAQEKRL